MTQYMHHIQMQLFCVLYNKILNIAFYFDTIIEQFAMGR